MEYHSTHHRLLLLSLHVAFSIIRNIFLCVISSPKFISLLFYTMRFVSEPLQSFIFNWNLVFFCLRIAFFIVVGVVCNCFVLLLLLLLFNTIKCLNCLKKKKKQTWIGIKIVFIALFQNQRHSQINLTLVKHTVEIVQCFGKWILINTNSSNIQSDSFEYF